jgi:peptidoglycan/xylan/chitin deacetylase (PgdA/CDA1 family)
MIADGNEVPHPRRAMAATDPTILLSFDVEEFDAPLARGRDMSMDEQMEVGGRGQARVLDMLDALDVPATMFTTASFAAWHPALQRRAAARHEIGSHGRVHLTFRNEDLAISRHALRESSGQEVLGFRRARLQPTDPQAILDAGYLWDSSENPIFLPGRYNNLRKPRVPYRKGALVELPVSASPVLRVPLFWLAWKNFPMAVIRDASARCLDRDGLLNVFWHPWEFVDLAASGLPRYMRAVDGERACDRFAAYIDFLRPHGRFGTFTPWVRAHSAAI